MLSINRKVRVLVVDDSAVARTFLTRGLSSYPNIEVVGYAVNALDARGKISSLAPDVMTLDVDRFSQGAAPCHPSSGDPGLVSEPQGL